MNNCPKCGNPLQIGTTSCPICGTNTLAEESAKTTVTVASVATPVTQPVVATTTPVQNPASEPVVVAQPEVKEVTPITEPVAQPVVTQTPVAETTPVVTPVTEPAPVAPTTEAQTTPINPADLAPTVQTIQAGTPVPSIPSSLNPDAIGGQSLEPAVSNKAQKVKKGINKNVLLILLIVLVAGGAGAFFLMGGFGKKTVTPPPPVTDPEPVAITSVSSNGYKLSLQDGWILTEDGENVVIINKDETVAIKLAHSSYGITSIDKETIENYFNDRTDFVDTKIADMTISAKEAYLVNTTISEAPIQVYFIGGGQNLTLGVTIVYHSSETKTKYEAAVTEMIGSLSYSDESYKAISVLDMYSNAFGIYSGIIAESQETEWLENQEPEYDDNGNEIIDTNGTITDETIGTENNDNSVIPIE